MSLYLPCPVVPTSAIYYHLPYHNTKCSHNDNVCWAAGAVTQFHAGRRQGARDVTKCSVKTCSSSLQHAAGPKVSPRGSAAGSRGPSPANKETKSGPERARESRAVGTQHSGHVHCASIFWCVATQQARERSKSYFLMPRYTFYFSQNVPSSWQVLVTEHDGWAVRKLHHYCNRQPH